MALMDHTERHPCRRYRNMESPCIEFLNARVSTPVVLRKVSTIIVLKGVSTPVVLLILSTPVVLRWFSTNIVLLPLTVAVGSSCLILKENYYYILPAHKDFLISGWCGARGPTRVSYKHFFISGVLGPIGPTGVSYKFFFISHVSCTEMVRAIPGHCSIHSTGEHPR